MVKKKKKSIHRKKLYPESSLVTGNKMSKEKLYLGTGRKKVNTKMDKGLFGDRAHVAQNGLKVTIVKG